MSRGVLSVGSNLGDRLAHLRSVVDALGPALVTASAVYETAPWGGVEQENFLNAVIVADDPARGPWDWLDFVRAAERAAGRVREQRWGPRTLDVDIVDVVDDVGATTSDDPELTLPHPWAARRAFVLVPWLDADPAARLGGRPVAELLAELPAHERTGVRRRADLRLTDPRRPAAKPLVAPRPGTPLPTAPLPTAQPPGAPLPGGLRTEGHG